MSEQSKLEQELFSAKWVVQSGNQIGKTAHCLRRIIDAWLASKAARLSIEVIEADLLRERREHQHLMAEKDKRIERLRDALGRVSEAYPEGLANNGYFNTIGDMARAALQEDGKCNKQKEKTK